MDRDVGSLKRHSKREGEVDEVPVGGFGRTRKFQGLLAVRIAQVRIVKRVDAIAEQPGEDERADDQDLGQRLRPLAYRLRRDCDQEDDEDDRGDD